MSMCMCVRVCLCVAVLTSMTLLLLLLLLLSLPSAAAVLLIALPWRRKWHFKILVCLLPALCTCTTPMHALMFVSACVCVSACMFDATWRAHTHTDKPQNHMPSPNQKQKCTRENAGKSNMFGPGTVAALPPYARKMLHSGNAGRDVDASSGIAAFNITKQILMLAEAQLDLQIYVCTHTRTHSHFKHT